MSNISKRRREGSRTKIKSMGVMGDHREFLKRITKTLYYGELPSLPCLSMPVTEISCEVWSEWQRGRSVRRLHADAAAGISRQACVSPAALVLALLYMERLRSRAPDYLSSTAPAELFLVTLMVGNKFLQDDGEDEEVICSEWAASGGLDLRQLRRLELSFLSAIDWNVFVNSECFFERLRWLERRVALRQAQLRGFFTYGDLAAALDGAAAAAAARALRDAAAACLAALAPLLALLASALMMTTCLPARPLTATLASMPPGLPHTFPPPLTLTQYVPNSTDLDVEMDEDIPILNERLSCCFEWMRHEELAVQKKTWFDSVVEYDWKLEPWWSRTSLLNWLYQSSLVSPLQRWLERINEYADLLAKELSGPREKLEKCRYSGGSGRGRCAQWLDLGKLGALLASMPDR